MLPCINIIRGWICCARSGSAEPFDNWGGHHGVGHFACRGYGWYCGYLCVSGRDHLCLHILYLSVILQMHTAMTASLGDRFEDVHSMLASGILTPG
jgi:hypothetical protein